MTDDAALFAAALAHPDADTPRLVLADWFDDHGEDELARGLREHSRIVPHLAGLTRWDRFPRIARPPTPAARVAAALLIRYRTHFPEPPGMQVEYDPDADWSGEHRPARVGPARFFYDWATAHRDQIVRLREAAAHAAARWPDEPVTFPAGDDPVAVETRGLLVHELVLRHNPVTAARAAAWDDLAARGHPLARVPGSLLPVEAEAMAGVRGYNPPAPRSRPLGPGVARPTILGHAEPEPDSPARAAVQA